MDTKNVSVALSLAAVAIAGAALYVALETRQAMHGQAASVAGSAVNEQTNKQTYVDQPITDSQTTQAIAITPAKEPRSAMALEELLRDDQAAMVGATDAAEQVLDQMAKAIDELWTEPSTSRRGMSATLHMAMSPTGSITDVRVTSSSGDAAFDSSAVQALRRLGRVPDVGQLSREDYENNFKDREVAFASRK